MSLSLSWKKSNRTDGCSSRYRRKAGARNNSVLHSGALCFFLSLYSYPELSSKIGKLMDDYVLALRSKDETPGLLLAMTREAEAAILDKFQADVASKQQGSTYSSFLYSTALILCIWNSYIDPSARTFRCVIFVLFFFLLFLFRVVMQMRTQCSV